MKAYALQSKDQVVSNLRTKYKKEIAPADKEYWDLMEKNGTWVDHIFIQITAWFMTLDILILTTSSQPENPFIHLIRKTENTPQDNSSPPLILGNYTNVHYQSLIPYDHPGANSLKTKKSPETRNEIIPDEENKEEFIFIQEGKTIIFKRTHLGRFKCPICNQVQFSIGSHIKSLECQIHKLQMDKKEFERQLENFKDGFRLEMSRKRKQKCRATFVEEKGVKGKGIKAPIDGMGPKKVKTVLNKQNKKSKMTNSQEPTNKTIPEQPKLDEFIYNQDGKTIIFKRLSLGRFECPFCKQEQPSIGSHIKSLQCKIHELNIDKKQFDSQLQSFKDGYRIEMNRRKKQRSRAKLLEEKGPELFKEEMKDQKSRSRKNLRDEKGPELIKVEMKEQKSRSRKNLRDQKGPELIKKEKRHNIQETERN